MEASTQNSVMPMINDCSQLKVTPKYIKTVTVAIYLNKIYCKLPHSIIVNIFTIFNNHYDSKMDELIVLYDVGRIYQI